MRKRCARSTEVAPEVKEQLKAIAAREQLKVSDIVRRAIRIYLEEHGENF